jgi:hypothetical protein
VLRLGLVPHFTKDLKACKRPINARSETAARSGMFRGALAVCRHPYSFGHRPQKLGVLLVQRPVRSSFRATSFMDIGSVAAA